MRANELMIGDWVSADFRPNFDIEHFRVNGIFHNIKQTHDSFPDYIVCELNAPIYVYELKPLPLTPEILEKNGLINYETNVGIVRYSGNNICIRGWMANCELYIGIIKYVHELQHALRLCGLNELADNFKV